MSYKAGFDDQSWWSVPKRSVRTGWTNTDPSEVLLEVNGERISLPPREAKEVVKKLQEAIRVVEKRRLRWNWKGRDNEG